MDTIMLLCTLVLAGFYLLEGGGGGSKHSSFLPIK